MIFTMNIYHDNIRTRFSRKVSGKKLTEKGVSPPLMDSPLPKTIFFAKNGIFCPKTPFLGQFLMDFFFTERGGTPPPLHGRPVPENLTEKS